MNKLPVLNLWAGPGAGKSTTCALVYGKLKQLGYNVEMAREYVKDRVWEQSFKVLTDQLYILGKQNHKLHILKGQCDCAITDSPLLTGLLYDDKSLKHLEDIALEAFNQYDNMNYVIARSKAYNPAGRMQTELEARGVDVITVDLLKRLNIPYKVIPYGDEGVNTIVQDFAKRTIDNTSNSDLVDALIAVDTNDE